MGYRPAQEILQIYTEPKIREPFFFYLKHIKGMESKAIKGCDLHMQQPKHFICQEYWRLRFAAIPPEVQHQVPGETQGFPYFWFCVYIKSLLKQTCTII